MNELFRMLLEMRETTDFMILGFTVILGTMLVYTISLFLRFRKLKQESEYLDGLGEE